MNDMAMKSLETILTIDDIPDNYKYLVTLIGLDNFIKLCEYTGGVSIYIPIKESIFMQIRNKKIKKDFRKYNTKELSIRYGLSQRWVEKLVGLK